MSAIKIRLFACVAALAVLLAATPSSAAEPGKQSGAMPAQLTTDGGTFAVTVKTNPQRIPLNEPFELLVNLRVLREVDDPNPLWLRVEATMPAHAHGMTTRAVVEQVGDGKFAVKGLLFHMAGDWEIVLHVAKGRIREQSRTLVRIE